jgi:fatty acid desaturase
LRAVSIARSNVTALATLDEAALTAAPAAPEGAWHEKARGLVGDLTRRSPFVYWADLLLSAGLAWGLTAVYFTAPAWSVPKIAAFLAASVLFFRAGTFIHEIVHMPGGQMLWFKRAWNLLLGVPFLMPWILYRNHTEHHNHRQFGTAADGEYLPLAASRLRETLKYLAQAPLLPLFMKLRSGVLGPASWLHSGLRHWVPTRASAAVSNPYYRKRFAARDERHLQIVELLCLGYLVTVAVLLARGTIGFAQVAMGYLLLAFTLGLNWVRNLAAHRYVNDGGRMSLAEQVAESINITGQTWFTVAMFPVGLRYHALHHMFPALPYHNLGKAHRRLMEGLPDDSPYRGCSRESFFGVVRELWQSARHTPPERSAVRARSARTERP